MTVSIGQTFSQIRRFTQADFDRFAALSGDSNPIHVNPDFSAHSKFGATVAHGMLIYSAVLGAIHHFLPGDDFIQQWQTLMFPSPTFAGTDVSIELMVTHADTESIRLETTTHNPDGSVGLQGETELRRTLTASPPSDSAPQPSVTLKGFSIGDTARTTRAFSRADLREFSALAETPVSENVPGPLVGGLFSYLLGMELPGRGTNYLKQSLYFTRTIPVDEKLTATVKISRIRPEKELVNLRTACTAADGAVVCTGEALVWVSDVPEGVKEIHHE